MGLFGTKPKNFAQKIRTIAEKAGMRILEEDAGDVVAVGFRFSDGRTQLAFLAPVGELKGTTVVDIWSRVMDVNGDLDQRLANRLLRENGSRKAGYWGIEKVAGVERLGCHHAMVLETLDPDEFKVMVTTVAKSADQLEEELTKKDDF